MYVLRRKIDGKFYRNQGYHWNIGKPLSDRWTDNLQEVKPFRSAQAAWGSAGPDRTGVFNEVKGFYERRVGWKDQYEVVLVKLVLA